MVAGDTDFDGHYGTGDSTAISGWAANSHPYRAYADVDLDGAPTLARRTAPFPLAAGG